MNLMLWIKLIKRKGLKLKASPKTHMPCVIGPMWSGVGFNGTCVGIRRPTTTCCRSPSIEFTSVARSIFVTEPRQQHASRTPPGQGMTSGQHPVVVIS